MKVAIFNVKYSPNLGDGLLAECLESELARHCSALKTVSIDLAGRTEFGGGGQHRATMIRVLELLPTMVRRRTAQVALSVLARVKLRPAYRAALAGCDAAVIGGGNLLADSDLNFPVKIALALSETRRRDLPVAVHAVGVTDNWSNVGKAMFVRGFARARLALATVRDEQSQTVWNKHMVPRGVAAATLARDPGLLAVRCYDVGRVAQEARSVAICITDPLAVRYHGGQGGDDALGAWYGAGVAALAAAGWSVALFTNGSPEDRNYLDRHAPGWIAASGGNVRQLPAFARPADLVAALARASLVVGHRMHACIAAYSCGVPAIGLRWDAKLDSFFELAGRSDYMVAPDRIDAAALVALAERALGEGIDPVRHAALLEDASASIAALATALGRAVGARA